MFASLFVALCTWLEQYRPPFPTAPPSKPPPTLCGFIIHYAKPFWLLITVSALACAGLALIEVALFAVVGDLIDWLHTDSRATFWTNHRTELFGLGALILIILPLMALVHNVVLHQGLLGNFAMRTRWQAHRYLLRQSVAFFQNDFAGRIAAKMMQTALAVRDTVVKVTEVLLYVVIYFIGALVLFLQSDVRLAVPMLGWLLGYLGILYYFIPRLRRVSMEQADARSVVTGRIVDSYTNITTVKLFAHAAHEETYARDGMQLFLDPVYRQMRLASALSVALTTLNALLLVAVGGTALWLWQLGAVSAGAIAVAIGLVLRLYSTSQWVLWEIWALFEGIGVVQDGIATLSNDIAVADRPQSRALEITEGKIEYRGIAFNYGKTHDKAANKTSAQAYAQSHDQAYTQSHDKIAGEGAPNVPGVIENLNLTIHGGEKIGIVGRSGAGKSTLVTLLLRFYDPEHGEIFIDGQELRTLTQVSLRAQIGMVTQDISLLHRSVFDNIRYGNATADANAVITAAHQARAHEFINTLVDAKGRRGYNAHVGERGVQLSGGQRQRIAIARVLLKNAPILILDEATSALDSAVESAIQENLTTLMQNKTVIAIAHRLSTIAQMQRLIIMDNGRIVEQGSHTALLARGGQYADLWARQSGGFIAGGG